MTSNNSISNIQLWAGFVTLAWLVAIIVLVIVVVASWMPILFPQEDAKQFAKENPELIFGDFGIEQIKEALS